MSSNQTCKFYNRDCGGGSAPRSVSGAYIANRPFERSPNSCIKSVLGAYFEDLYSLVNATSFSNCAVN